MVGGGEDDEAAGRVGGRGWHGKRAGGYPIVDNKI